MIKSTAKAQTLSTVPCKPVLNYYFKYLTAPHPGINRYFPIQATFILQGRYVTYYIGSLSYDKSSDSLSGTVTASFSDRTWTPSCGSIQYILNSWGNAKFKDQLQCYGINKPFYTAPTKQSSSMFVMTLQKAENVIPK
ncbi:unnamed protein product [Rotaria sp. Silwood1]|nr:unnamed protein product [Rotaria sp. Silwood1]CAF1556873.1 unnamed protein product [Rotaria sp. Silwood1]CAF3594757.1 unnamed protein product [Rotaria sp. Silwood1]CAF3674968.1 unnamed protein product [Rotaria sp. Silwood1]CAF4611813.1 unnamed protein product [Rotaria sp. Silwood1]